MLHRFRWTRDQCVDCGARFYASPSPPCPFGATPSKKPDYEVIRKLDPVELRQYAPYVVAEVVLNASAEEAGSQAFPILAGYIFGKNKGERKFAMTAPVTQTAAPVKLEMTAPVTQSAVPGGMRVQFVLPRGVTLDVCARAAGPCGCNCASCRPAVGGDPLFGDLVAVQLRRASGLVAGGAGPGRCGHSGRTRAGALQRAVHAMVPAAQRDLAGFALMRLLARLKLSGVSVRGQRLRPRSWPPAC
jgi:hypothetical protein